MKHNDKNLKIKTGFLFFQDDIFYKNSFAKLIKEKKKRKSKEGITLTKLNKFPKSFVA